MAYANGQLPASMLAPIAGGRLRKDAAASFNAMNVEARRLGLELRPTGSLSSYRDLAGQQELWRRYQNGTGALAARPGTSNHGTGIAVDFATTQMRAMVDRIGRKYGWAKSWSDAPGEWWHIVYKAGVWSGPDPGPEGKPAPPPKPEQPKPEPEEDEMRLAIAYNADGRVQLARIEGRANNNQIFENWMGKDGKWAGWRRVPAAEGRTRPWVSVQFARHPDGRLEMFAMTDGDVVWRRHQTGPNAGWVAQLVKA